MTPRKNVLALGEVLWDVFPGGPKFGGAAANFACAVAELGRGHVHTLLASAVGRDALGRDARATLAAHGVDTALVAECGFETGHVFVEVNAAGQPSYRFLDDPAWDHLDESEHLGRAAKAADVVYFGTLGQRTPAARRVIQTAVRAAPAGCPRVLDINLRKPYFDRGVIAESLALATVLKINDEELPVVAGLLGLAGPDESLPGQLMDHFPVRVVALTCGADGSRVFDRTGAAGHCPGRAVPVADTVGAGDAFTAALVLGLAHGLPLDATNTWANDVAAYVCTQPGGTPTFPPHLQLSQVVCRT